MNFSILKRLNTNESIFADVILVGEMIDSFTIMIRNQSARSELGLIIINQFYV